MNNVLVIGGTGFIGANIVSVLLFRKYNVFTYELANSDTSVLGTNVNKVDISYGKLEQIDELKRLLEQKKINIVVHLASTLIPSSTIDEYVSEFKSIIQPTIKLLPILAKANIKLVYFSSGGTVYGNYKNGPYSELDDTLPISYYGQSKLIIEESIKLENRISGLRYLIIRPSNPYGNGQQINGKQGLIATVIGRILNQDRVTIWGDGTIVRDYIHINDLVNNVVNIMDNGKENEIFNIGSGKGYSINEIIKLLSECLNKKIEIDYHGARSVDVKSLILNVEKYNGIFNSQNISLDEGIMKFYLNEYDKRMRRRP